MYRRSLKVFMKLIGLRLMRRIPYSEWLRDVVEMLIPAKREGWLKELRDLRRIRAEVSGAAIGPLYGCNPKRVLFIGSGQVSMVYLETFFRKSFELAGYCPVVLIPKKRIVKEAYENLGQQELVFIDEFEPLLPCRKARVGPFRSLSEMLALSFRGIRCGKYAASTLMRTIRSGSFNFQSLDMRRIAADAVATSIDFAIAAEQLIEAIKPDALVCVDRGYSPSGELFDACIQKGIPAYTWNAAHRNNVVTLKRYTAHNEDVHPSSLSKASWGKLRALEWTDAHWKMVRGELFDSYRSGEWYGEVGTQLNKKFISRADLLQRLSLEVDKKTAVIFPHIFWDSTFFWGEDLWGDYETWFIEVVKAACKNTKLNWIIKVHPANLVKNVRDKFLGECSEVSAIDKSVGPLPSHIRLLGADTDISTFSIHQIMDYCLTVRGTIGIEAACFGIPVLTAGTGRYDRLGFTHDFVSREAYISQLESLPFLPSMTASQIELARRYAYGVFLCRTAKLESLTLEFRKDSRAELVTSMSEKAKRQIEKCDDIRDIASWITSGEEDYFELPGINVKGDVTRRDDAKSQLI